VPSDTPGYVLEWEDKLLQPEKTLAAALRLEALGQPGIPALRNAMTSEYPLVRFAAAEALAYLGQPLAAETLQKIALEHPSLQAYALTALAALDDALASSRLEELLAAREPELRYGAFRALREMDPSNTNVRGEWARRAFVIHEVQTTGTPLIHLLREGRAEVVLFGESPKLIAPFSLTAGPSITITAREGDTVATVSRFSGQVDSSPNHVQCSLAVADVLRTMAEVGATYTDAADMIQKAHARKALTAKLAFDALPKAVPIKRLAESARSDPHMVQEYELLAETDLANTPGLFAGPVETGKRE
jgi:HEAT repeats